MTWAVCLMWGINPPGTKLNDNWKSWDELDANTQARMIAFYQTSEHESFEKAKVGVMSRL